MKPERLATGGAIGASLLIASCCVAPTLFLVFGISVGALGALSALEPYRPAFIALGGAALLYAGGRAWRPAPATAGPDAHCQDDACAADSRQRRRTHWLVAGGVVLYAAAIVYPYALGALL